MHRGFSSHKKWPSQRARKSPWKRVDPFLLERWLNGDHGEMTREQLMRCIPHDVEREEAACR